MLSPSVVDVVDVEAVSEQEQLNEVVEDNPDTLVVEGVPKPVLVAVVHPLGHPHHGLHFGILSLVLHSLRPSARLAADELT